MDFRRTSATHGRTRYDDAERRLRELVAEPGLDGAIARDASLTRLVDEAIAVAIDDAYGDSGGGDGAAHLFLQRALYAVNRLKLFWYDDLSAYENERSDYLRSVRDRVEEAWQAWEADQLDREAIAAIEDVPAALAARAREDLDPAPSVAGAYFQNHCGIAGYRRLLEIFSLDALVEASQLSRTLGGVTNGIHMVMTKLLLEEYGNGKTERKHSTYFAAMLGELGMDATPEAYLDAVPWEVLAAVNHSFLLSERKRFYLRYAGGLLYTEVSTPAGFRNYRAAAERLGLHGGGLDYWQLHVREDARHGRWMLDDVALPLAERFPAHARELVLGYDQQRLMSGRAGSATARAAQAADAAASRAASAPEARTA